VIRRAYAALICCAVVQLIVPTSAYAWWEYVEQLSGPGPFWGFDVDGRLYCFVDTSGDARSRGAALDATAAAKRQSEGENLGEANPGPPDANKWRNARDAWRRARQAWEVAALGSREPGAAAKRYAEELEEKLTGEPNDVAILKTQAQAYENSAAALRVAVTDNNTRPTVRFAPGFIYSSCKLKPGERRRGTIDLGMRFVWTHDPDFANERRITMTTLEPAISWSVINGAKYPGWDVVDYGLGAGMYWIASTEFPSLRGPLLEPVRLDFHFPAKAAPWARALVVRYGLLVFPRGFEATAFAPTNPDKARRISRDWVNSVSIYLDLESLLNK
jgi:hypothetical protein